MRLQFIGRQNHLAMFSIQCPLCFGIMPDSRHQAFAREECAVFGVSNANYVVGTNFKFQKTVADGDEDAVL